MVPSFTLLFGTFPEIGNDHFPLDDLFYFFGGGFGLKAPGLVKALKISKAHWLLGNGYPPQMQSHIL